MSKKRSLVLLIAVAASQFGNACLSSTEASEEDIATITETSKEDVATILVAAVGDTLRGINRSYQFIAFALDDSDNVIEGVDFSWSSSDLKVATVDPLGLVNTVSEGTSTIAAMAGDVLGEADVVVNDRAAMLAGGQDFTCALDSDGAAYCWGAGYLGDGNQSRVSPTPVKVAGDITFHSLTAGWEVHTCGLATDGTAYCWGFNYTGVLGVGGIPDQVMEPQTSPVPVATELKFKMLRSGQDHSCGLTFTGEAYCWGRNHVGQLGTSTDETCGSEPCSTIPVPVSGDLRFEVIGLVAESSCGIDREGVVYCWGRLPADSHDPTVTATASPTALNTGARFTSIVGAHSAICGLGTDGVVYCWGGDPNILSASAPTPVPNQPEFVLLSEMAGLHICGLDAQGAAYCWGLNSLGQLGNGTLASGSHPTPVSGGLKFYSITAGDLHTCAMTPDFAAYCWGRNLAGQLGDGTFGGEDCYGDPCRTTPVQVLFDPRTQ